MIVDKVSIRDKLWEKASKEQSEYIAELKKMAPDLIVEKSYETTMRQDILSAFEGERQVHRMSDEQVKSLLNLMYPIDVCYGEWQKSDVTYMDKIEETIYKLTNELVEEEKEKHKSKKKHEPER